MTAIIEAAARALRKWQALEHAYIAWLPSEGA
jgi:hypothetical protein